MDGMGPAPHVFARLHRVSILGALVVFAAAALIALTGWADAARVTVLGAGPVTKSSCPDRATDGCYVEAKVTAIQTKIAGERKPFVARGPGRIVAWSIKLGRPDAKDRRCLSEGCAGFKGFGGPARARLSILRPIVRDIKQGRPTYKLLAQSPVEELTAFFGTTTTFTLQRPLKIGRGQIAALTIPTWAPVFVRNLGRGNAWRASRKPTKKRGGCFLRNEQGEVVGANVKAGSPHQKIGTERSYACAYGGNRLLYSATMVRRPRSE